METEFPKIGRNCDMRAAGELLVIAYELIEISNQDYEQKDFKDCLDKFTNLYKKSSDTAQSEYHKFFAEKMKNG